MSRTPARITQADVARAIRAAQKAGASAVEIKPDGSLLIRLVPTSPLVTDAPVEPTKEIVL
jgi:hypothetical protein